MTTPSEIAGDLLGAKETMRILINKYPEGYEGRAKERGEKLVQRVIAETSVVPKV